MTDEVHGKNKKWIKEYLTPNLITNQKLVICKNANKFIDVKSIEIQEMSSELSFMISNCYFVRIVLQIEEEEGDQIEEKGDKIEDKTSIDEREFNLVVKVWFINE